jgi:hypothetical protein
MIVTTIDARDRIIASYAGILSTTAIDALKADLVRLFQVPLAQVFVLEEGVTLQIIRAGGGSTK